MGFSQNVAGQRAPVKFPAGTVHVRIRIPGGVNKDLPKGHSGHYLLV